MSERTGKVQTVLGLVEPTALGHTQPHEHLLVNLLPPHLQDIEAAPITIETLGDLRKNAITNPENLRLTCEDDAIAELTRYKASGGGAIVDASPRGLARNPEGLQRIARATGIHVIMGSGYYELSYHPPEVAELDEGALAESIIRDVVDGDPETGVRAGIIGEVGMSWPTPNDEAKVLRAATRAQQATGTVLMIHPGRHPDGPFEAMRIVEDAGGDPTRVIVCHIERTLFSLEPMLELASMGCALEFDLFGQESSHYPFAPIDMPNDAVRVDYLRSLMDAGHGEQLLMSQDICMKVHLTRYGGEGYYHILETVLPIMERKGWSREDIDQVTVRNPARMLAFQ